MNPTQSNSLDDKVVVIIGGTSGLGFSAARACVDAGANVVVVGRSQDKADRVQDALGKACHAIVGDAATSSTAVDAIDAAVSQFGGFHALYHVAGGSGRQAGDGPLHELTDDGWRFTLQLNLASVAYSNRAAIRQFLRQKTGGVVLNMTSVLASSPAPRYFATHAYAAAKAGIVGLTRSLAAYYAPHDIRVNAVAPALTETPMSERACGDAAILDYVHARQPLAGGRVGRSNDLDAAVVYFLSDASRYVTGQVLAIDGGWSVSDAAPPSESAS